MIFYPPSKINIGLNIISKRVDGFHNIETCFYPINLCDILEILESENGGNSFSSSGISIPGGPDKNICIQAWQLLNKKIGIPPVKMHLHKQVPIGAGLGGGSADGAFALKGISELFSLGLSVDELEGLAAQLGSDCAFFIRSKSALGFQRGELLKPFGVGLTGFTLVVVNPGIHVNTALAYKNILPKQPEESLEDILLLPVEKWKDVVQNDFEPGVFKEFPKIGELKNRMYELGAVYSAMSGSGSTVFGLFKGDAPEKVEEQFSPSFVHVEKI